MNSPLESRTLAQLRALAGLTQSEVARTLGTSQEAVAKLERGSNPRLSTVLSYAIALGGTAEVVVTVGGRRSMLKLPSLREDGADTGAGFPARVEAWCVRGWNDREHESRCLDRQIIAISSGDEFDQSMATPRSDTELRELIKARYEEREARAIGVFMGYTRSFGERMALGDVIVMPLSGHRDAAGTHQVAVGRRRVLISGYMVAIGIVAGEYVIDTEAVDPLFRHRRDVDWLAVVPIATIPPDIRSAVNAPGTIRKASAPDAAGRLMLLARDWQLNSDVAL